MVELTIVDVNDDGGVVLVQVVGGHESKLVLNNDNNSGSSSSIGEKMSEKVEKKRGRWLVESLSGAETSTSCCDIIQFS